jgi:hypothetical protein
MIRSPLNKSKRSHKLNHNKAKIADVFELPITLVNEVLYRKLRNFSTMM